MGNDLQRSSLLLLLPQSRSKMLGIVTQCSCLLSVLVQVTANSANGLEDNCDVRAIRNNDHEDSYKAWYSFMRYTDEGALLSIGLCMTYHEGEGTFGMMHLFTTNRTCCSLVHSPLLAFAFLKAWWPARQAVQRFGPLIQ